MLKKLRLPLVAGWELCIAFGKNGSFVAIDKFDSNDDITVNGIAFIIAPRFLQPRDPMFWELEIEFDVYVAHCQTTIAIRRFGRHAN